MKNALIMAVGIFVQTALADNVTVPYEYSTSETKVEGVVHSDLCSIVPQPSISTEKVDKVICAHGDGSVTTYFVTSEIAMK